MRRRESREERSDATAERGPTEGTRSGERPVDSLHRSLGNRAIQELHRNGDLQPKLAVAPARDGPELEAERVARTVTARSAESGSAPRIRRQSTGGGATLDGRARRQIESLTGGGEPLSESTRSYFEPRFGRSFDDVRVHTGPPADEAARSIDAEAFTLGSDVVFARGNYRPDTRGGKRLIAHELTHVVQQSGRVSTVRRTVNDDTKLEDLDEDIRKGLTVSVDLNAEDLDVADWTEGGTIANVEAVYGQGVDDELGSKMEYLGEQLNEIGKLDKEETITVKIDPGSIHEFDEDRIDSDSLVIRFTYYESSGAGDRLLIENLGGLDAWQSSSDRSLSDYPVEIDESDWSDSQLEVFRTALEMLPDAVMEEPSDPGERFVAGVAFEPAHELDEPVERTDWAAKYKERHHTIYVKDELFDQSATVFGQTSSSAVSNSVRRVVHELAHAIDFRRHRWWFRRKRELQQREADLEAELEAARSQGEDEGRSSEDLLPEGTTTEGPLGDPTTGDASGSDEQGQTGDQGEEGDQAEEHGVQNPRDPETIERELRELQDLKREHNQAMDTDYEYSESDDRFVGKMQSDRPSGVSERVPITPYTGSSEIADAEEYRVESFAEMYSLYVTAPELLREIRPEVYDYFDSHSVLSTD